MAPHAAPLPLPVAAAHRGWRSGDDDDDDDSPKWRQPTASPTVTAGGNDVAQLPGVEVDADDGDSVNPVAIILPVLGGVALLLLAVGGFLIWRRRRRAAAAAASDTSTEMRASTTASESAQDLRGGAGEFGYGEKYYPGQPEVPPRYEESQHDRSVSVSTATTTAPAPAPAVVVARATDDPFNDAYAYPPRDRRPHDDGHDETPVSPVSESAADRGVTADGYRHDGR